jgi:hypothetical protein
VASVVATLALPPRRALLAGGAPKAAGEAAQA